MSGCETIHVTQLIRKSLRQFFTRPLRQRTDASLRALFRALCNESICLTAGLDGIHRTYSSESLVTNSSAVTVYFVRDHVTVYTTLSCAESHPLLSSAFHGTYANESLVCGTIYNVRAKMEQMSSIIYIMDMPCDAFFITDWMPDRTESIRDVVRHMSSNLWTFR